MRQYVKSKDYETVQLDEEWFIMNTDQFTVTKINELGGYCWSQLATPQSVDTLTQQVMEQFHIENKLLSINIEEFLKELIEYGLVRHAI